MPRIPVVPSGIHHDFLSRTTDSRPWRSHAVPSGLNAFLTMHHSRNDVQFPDKAASLKNVTFAQPKAAPFFPIKKGVQFLWQPTTHWPLWGGGCETFRERHQRKPSVLHGLLVSQQGCALTPCWGLLYARGPQHRSFAVIIRLQQNRNRLEMLAWLCLL